jgi:hypothetical protein
MQILEMSTEMNDQQKHLYNILKMFVDIATGGTDSLAPPKLPDSPLDEK